MFKFFRKKKKEPENLEEVLSRFEDLKKDFKKLSERLDSLKKESKLAIQKVGVVRFNPFSEIGGDQSFSIALLDAKNSGFVITSLFSREGNRVFAKPIRQGESEYSLSKEEMEAIKKAMQT